MVMRNLKPKKMMTILKKSNQLSVLVQTQKKMSKYRKAPKKTRTVLVVMEHRFWLFMTKVAIKDLDEYAERLKITFKWILRRNIMNRKDAEKHRKRKRMKHSRCTGLEDTQAKLMRVYDYWKDYHGMGDYYIEPNYKGTKCQAMLPYSAFHFAITHGVWMDRF